MWTMEMPKRLKKKKKERMNERIGESGLVQLFEKSNKWHLTNINYIFIFKKSYSCSWLYSKCKLNT